MKFDNNFEKAKDKFWKELVNQKFSPEIQTLYKEDISKIRAGFESAFRFIKLYQSENKMVKKVEGIWINPLDHENMH